MTIPYLDTEAILNGNKLDGRRNNKGRPKGSGKGYERKNERWDPKKLTATHYAILSLKAAGLKNEEIAKEVGKGKESINQLCNSSKGKAYIQLILDGAAKQFKADTEQALIKTSTRAVKNIEMVLEDDELRELQPFRMFDRSMNFLKATGKMRGDAPIVMGGATLTAIGDSAIKAMADALRESNGYTQKEELAEKVEVVIESSKSQQDTQSRIGSGQETNLETT